MYNSETQRNLTKNGETLLGALNFFTSSINTLCNKTIEDTLQTIRQYETARCDCFLNIEEEKTLREKMFFFFFRVEYDAYRSDLEVVTHSPRTDSNTASIEEAHRNYELHKQHFMKLRGEVAIKMKFLEENRVSKLPSSVVLLYTGPLRENARPRPTDILTRKKNVNY